MKHTNRELIDMSLWDLSTQLPNVEPTVDHDPTFIQRLDKVLDTHILIWSDESGIVQSTIAKEEASDSFTETPYVLTWASTMGTITILMFETLADLLQKFNMFDVTAFRCVENETIKAKSEAVQEEIGMIRLKHDLSQLNNNPSKRRNPFSQNN